MGYQDGRKLFVIIRDEVWLAVCVSLNCVEFGSTLLLLVRCRYISPGLSVARDRASV